MKKNLWVIIFVTLIIIVLGVFWISFQVRETETALVVRFGKPQRAVTEPGWYLQLPKPIETVYKFDSRAQLLEGVMEETNTAGGDPIIVTSYITWKIAEPQKFLESVRDKRGAENKLRSLLANTQNTVIGRHYFSEFVNSDPAKIKLAVIENEMLGLISAHAAKEYGVEVKNVGIKQLGVSEQVSKDVFERMRADRQRKTNAILAQGEAEATRIKTEAEAKKKELLAVVDARAKAVLGEGDAEAARYYKQLEADPEFAMFLRDIEALKKILNEKTTIVLGAETEPLELLKGVPDIEPKP